MQKSLRPGINELTASLSFKHEEIHSPKLKTLIELIYNSVTNFRKKGHLFLVETKTILKMSEKNRKLNRIFTGFSLS